MKCNLCLEDTELLRKSHIIPQFMYKAVKSDGGIFIKIDKYTFREYSKGKSLTWIQTTCSKGYRIRV